MTGTGIMTFVDDTQFEAIEKDPPDSILDFNQAHRFTDQRRGYVHVVALPTDKAGSGHPSTFVVARVLNFPKAKRKSLEGGTVQIPRPAKVDRLVRALLVVLRAEPIEPALL